MQIACGLMLFVLLLPGYARAVSIPEIQKYIMTVNKDVPEKDAKVYARSIVNAAKEFDVPAKHLVAMMKVESTYKHTAKSEKGAVGLMQVNTTVWLSPQNEYSLLKAGVIHKAADLRKPSQNIRAGAYILRHYLDKAERKKVKHPLRFAVAKYSGNGGTSYLRRVNKALAHFKQFKENPDG